jgi:enoyl-CoA hydratase/carnithine racemase
MALPETSVGLLPCGTGTQTLPWLVGEGWAKRMILTNERVDAGTALRIGLVEQVVGRGQARQAAVGIAQRTCGLSPRAVEYSKQLIHLARQGTPRAAALARSASASSTCSTARISAKALRRSSRSASRSGKTRERGPRPPRRDRRGSSRATPIDRAAHPLLARCATASRSSRSIARRRSMRSRSKWCRSCSEQLREFAQRRRCPLGVLRGAGGKAFCAGGDMRALYDSRSRRRPIFARGVLRRGIRLDYLLHRYPKPTVVARRRHHDGRRHGPRAGLASCASSASARAWRCRKSRSACFRTSAAAISSRACPARSGPISR